MATGFPVAEARPGAQIPADLEEAVLELGAHRPVAMAAVAELVHGRSLAAADALLDHAWSTFFPPARLRLVGLPAPGKELVGPRRSLSFPGLLCERGLEGSPLLIARPRRDLDIHAEAD